MIEAAYQNNGGSNTVKQYRNLYKQSSQVSILI